MRTEPEGTVCADRRGRKPPLGGAMRKNPLAVYIHIPFCMKKCAYCDFLSFPRDAVAGGEESQRRYFDALLTEIDAAAETLSCGTAQQYEVHSIYFGGGTPSFVDARHIEAMLDRLAAHFALAPDTEISMECNPGTADPGKLRRLRAAGVNRLSIGIQSFDDAELRLIGRIHTAADATRCFADAREAGFDNVSLDLMAALPGQTEEALLKNVRRAAAFAPEHLSLYSLIVEPGTPFYARYADEVVDPHFDRMTRAARRRMRDGEPRGTSEGAPHLPDEEAERAMLHAAWETLAMAGYRRYEISNFARAGREADQRAALPVARPDYRCRHNLTYWMRGDYLGLGLGAASLIDNVRFANTRDMTRYLAVLAGGEAGRAFRPANVDSEGSEYPGGWDAPHDRRALANIRENRESLTVSAQMEEFMFLGLRLTEGVSEARFAQTFDRALDAVYGETIAQLSADGLLTRRGGRVLLTDRGTDLANYVMAQFLL